MYPVATLAADPVISPIGVPVGELIIAVVGFGLLFFVLRKLAWPMFEKAYSARTAAIEGGIAQAAEAQTEAAAALAEYQRQLAGAREEAGKIREDARAQAQSIRDDMLAAAHAETERIAAAGRAQLDAQRAQIVAELRGDLGRVSVELASKVVGESLEDEARQRRTVERFLAELEN
ncbi:F0F1 ATP synthase subunit B [Nakamurella sp. PAMC28650]|jgi:F-type H+-transporting ATPase subunit b|uniref:F0F1 ATP synthase subunit B n=1 Tax=Nakamurella sp. PAMC28650 TaxID=2762325 RepID=UPI00164D6750|nr:F0F1 ATP synthase subunit B [Nakamurella sp. PAMC28650]QNK80155.1 F0F1 ATP synthase subunit B [Nakamurella sp. PAMC28650]